MSAIVGRLLIAVGIGVVSALYYTYYRNRQEERSHHSHSRRRGPRNDSYPYPSNTWREDDEYDFLNPSPRPRPRTTSEPRRRFNDDAGSLCPICLETFRDLKKKGVTIWSTPCGHLFCEECLSKALRERRRRESDGVLLPSCPTCRECVPGLKSCREEFI